MRLYLLAFGKLKTSGLRETADYYYRLLRPWVEIKEIELKPIHVSDKSAASRVQIQKKEETLLTGQLESLISPRGRFYLLDETGRSEPTLAWAERVKRWEGESVSEVAFCIGSSLGFSAEIRKKAHGTLSLGAQTLSHELARIVLLEQIYRSWSVVRGHPYHNEG